jgi:hypothetical protein
MGIYWGGEVYLDVRPTKRWHRHEYAGRHFRILIEARERWDVILFVVVKIDEVVSAEEVRIVRLPGEVSAVDQTKALEAAHAAIARHVRGTEQFR